MNQQGIITIVYGYHNNTPVPQLVYKENLSFRFAIIFETAFSKYDVSFFQAELFMKLISAINTQIDCNDIQVDVDEKTQYQTIDLFKENLFKLAEDSRIPPLRVFFRKNNTLMCLEETEFWAFCGGSAPYSDSYTASFYTKKNMRDVFDSTCSSVCSNMGVIIRERIQGFPHPKQSWWKRQLKGLITNKTKT